MTDPDPTPPAGPGSSPVGTLALAGLVAALAGSWFWSRHRERPVADRTRARLAPPIATAGSPDARGIKVG